MFDTINLWLPSEQAGTTNLLAYTEPFLKHVTESKNEYGQIYLNGVIGSNYIARVFETGLSLKGSLAKYFLNDNYHTLTRSDSQRAIEMMSDELHLSIDKATVRRIDFAQNFLMKYEPETYYNYLGQCPHYKRFMQPNSIYYNNGKRTMIFYNKIAEGKAKKGILPEVWKGLNVLRFEMRFEKRLNEQFNRALINAGTLPDEKFYMEMVKRWSIGYEAIDKLNEINLNLSNMKSPKDILKHFALMKINEIGQDNAMQMIEDLRAKNTFAHKEYYSRIKAEIKDLCKAPDLTTTSELITELDKKVKAVKRFCR